MSKNCLVVCGKHLTVWKLGPGRNLLPFPSPSCRARRPPFSCLYKEMNTLVQELWATEGCGSRSPTPHTCPYLPLSSWGPQDRHIHNPTPGEGGALLGSQGRHVKLPAPLDGCPGKMALP